MGIIPFYHARVFAPLLIIHRITALEDHPVDAAGATQDFATPMINTAVIHVGFGFRLIHPIVMFVANRDGEGGGHVDKNIPEGIIPPCLNHQNAMVGVFAQAVCQDAPCRTTPDNDCVIMCCHTRYQLSCEPFIL